MTIEYNLPDSKHKPPLKQQRCEYFTYPIYYCNQKEPAYYGIRMYFEEWNEEKKQWEYLWWSEKLFYTNGCPAP